MKVDKVTVNVRYSRALAQGEHKTVELGVEASIDAREDWQAAQATLYSQLAQQFRELWQKNGTTPHALDVPVSSTGQAPGGHQIGTQPSSAVEAPPAPASLPAATHYCTEHNQEFQRRVNKDTGKEFYSHRQDKGWCNEQGGWPQGRAEQ